MTFVQHLDELRTRLLRSVVEPVPNIGDCLGLVLTLTILLGAVFQLPLMALYEIGVWCAALA